MNTYAFVIKDTAPDEVDELNTNMKTLLETREGTQPGDRDFGISWGCLDEIQDVAECMLVAEIAEKLSRYEPRLELDDLEFTHEEGKLIPRITLRRKKEADRYE